MLAKSNTVLIIGSAPDALRAAAWDKKLFSHVLVINNAWQVRPDWDFLLHPEDFAAARMPLSVSAQQTVITAHDYVPVQNDYGGFVYAGGTMAFTSAYWALGRLKPQVIAFIGCDMVYATTGKPTHFYGNGQADPLRADVSLQSLEAKSVRLLYLAAQQQCRCVNLSQAAQSRLLMPRSSVAELQADPLATNNSADCFDHDFAAQALQRELDLGYQFASGRYWEHLAMISASACASVDALWLKALVEPHRQPESLARQMPLNASQHSAG